MLINNFIKTVVFDLKKALMSAKLAILERLELWIFFASSQPCWEQIWKFISGKFFGILQKLICHHMHVSQKIYHINIVFTWKYTRTFCFSYQSLIISIKEIWKKPSPNRKCMPTDRRAQWYILYSFLIIGRCNICFTLVLLSNFR